MLLPVQPVLENTHLISALGYHACKHGHTISFTQAIDIINHLAEAQANGIYIEALKEYKAPDPRFSAMPPLAPWSKPELFDGV